MGLYENSGYWLSIILFVWAIVYWTLGNRLNIKSVTLPNIGNWVTVTFVGLAMVYGVLSHLTLMGTLVLDLEYGRTPECTNLLSNTTTTGNVTIYEYTNSCASLTTPPVHEYYVTVYGFLIFLDILLVFFGMLLFSATFLLQRG